MKKLGKLSINPERIIKNEELVNLKGGDYSGEACLCTSSTTMYGNILLPADCSTSGCTTECNHVFGPVELPNVIIGMCKSAG